MLPTSLLAHAAIHLEGGDANQSPQPLVVPHRETCIHPKGKRIMRIHTLIVIIALAAATTIADTPRMYAQSAGPTHFGRTFPAGSVVFPPYQGGAQYEVVYMPLSSGRGLYFQPFLPQPGQRTPFGVAVVVQPGIYHVYGQGCETWLNADGNSPLRSGWLMTVGVEIKEYPPTAGRNESWVAFICDGDGASTASISLIPAN